MSEDDACSNAHGAYLVGSVQSRQGPLGPMAYAVCEVDPETLAIKVIETSLCGYSIKRCKELYKQLDPDKTYVTTAIIPAHIVLIKEKR